MAGIMSASPVPRSPSPRTMPMNEPFTRITTIGQSRRLRAALRSMKKYHMPIFAKTNQNMIAPMLRSCKGPEVAPLLSNICSPIVSRATAHTPTPAMRRALPTAACRLTKASRRLEKCVQFRSRTGTGTAGHSRPFGELGAQRGDLPPQVLYLGEDRRRFLLDDLAFGFALGCFRLLGFGLHGVDHHADEQVEYHERGHDDEGDQVHPAVGMMLHHRLGDVVGPAFERHHSEQRVKRPAKRAEQFRAVGA